MVFLIGDVDLEGVATVANYNESKNEITLTMNLTGDKAMATEYLLEHDAEYMGKVKLVEPVRGTPMYIDLSPDRQNSTSLRISSDHLYNGDSINEEVVWLDYRPEHEPGVPDHARITARFGKQAISEFPEHEETVINFPDRMWDLIDDCESGWQYEESDSNGAISGTQGSSDWNTEGNGSLKISGGTVAGGDYATFMKKLELSSFDKIKPDVRAKGDAGSDRAKIQIGIGNELKWEKCADKEKIYYPEIVPPHYYTLLDSCESGWTYSETDENDVISGTQGATDEYVEGSGSIKVGSGSSPVTYNDYGQFEKSLDLTNTEKIKLWVKGDGNGGRAGTYNLKPTAYLKISIGGTRKFKRHNCWFSSLPGETIEINTSDYSGMNIMQVKLYNIGYISGGPTDYPLGNVWVDNIRRKKEKRWVTFALKNESQNEVNLGTVYFDNLQGV